MIETILCRHCLAANLYDTDAYKAHRDLGCAGFWKARFEKAEVAVNKIRDRICSQPNGESACDCCQQHWWATAVFNEGKDK